MSQSLACVHIHLVFSTKNRERFLRDSVRESLHAYLAGILQNLGCTPVLINSVEDHIHLLFDLARTMAISRVVEELKKSSSKWIKTQGPAFHGFAWQAGYGAFAVSASNVEDVCQYIAQQREHHRQRSFQEEFLLFLERHQMTFDERFIWE